MADVLKRFLAGHKGRDKAPAVLGELRRKYRTKVNAAKYEQARIDPSKIGAGPEEIKAWAKALVKRREAKKQSKQAKIVSPSKPMEYQFSRF